MEGAELIVVARPSASLRARRGGSEVLSLSGEDVRGLARLVGDTVRLVPLFGNEERLIARAASEAAEAGKGGPDLSVFYRVEAPADRLEEIAETLRNQESVEAAYVKPPAEPPFLNDEVPPDAEEAPPATPNFVASQVYLGTAPAGIEAHWAQTQPGGRGNGIRIIDIEGAWRFDHEDLTQVQGGVVGGVQSADIRWRNHGTAVIGVFGGDDNTFGITGIVPMSNTRAISIFGPGQGSAKAIRDAADLLTAGDIILIELHRPGPRHNFQSRDDQRGYIAVEWWEDDWTAIRYATNKGVIVVEAAGNGAENLDDGIYALRPANFPATWTNPFNRANRDCGAVVVDAGAPPAGTHGRDHGPDRSRLDFSNFSACVDAQGWGREVTTAGYGVLQGGSDENLWYTDRFSGTSSASPIVVGAVAAMQGNRKAKGQALYTPAQVRSKLRTSGSPQTDAPGRPATQRIGNRPNLKTLLGFVKPVKEIIKDKEFKEGKEKVEIKEQLEKQVDKQFDKPVEKPVEKQVEKGLEKTRVVGGFGSSVPQAGSVEGRLFALESAITQIAHFISGELRPDLSQGALSGEADAAQGLDAAGASAKAAKDNK
ncbi:MAG: S8 family serine peptidase, partial [Acidobacteria bacterium]|nr:S8 family serine peptidase [Acidobacteriota bacterium]